MPELATHSLLVRKRWIGHHQRQVGRAKSDLRVEHDGAVVQNAVSVQMTRPVFGIGSQLFQHFLQLLGFLVQF